MELILPIALVYSVAGLLFALWFVAQGYRVLDAGAVDTGLLTRLLWLPAAALLWPLLIGLILRRRSRAAAPSDSGVTG